jgi:hypothetical protein
MFNRRRKSMLQENTGLRRRFGGTMLCGLLVLAGAAALSGPAAASCTTSTHRHHHQAYREPNPNHGGDYYSYYGARPESDGVDILPNGEVNIPYRLSR